MPSPGLEPGRFGLKDTSLQVDSSVYEQLGALRCAQLRSDFASSGHIAGHVAVLASVPALDTSVAKRRCGNREA